MDRIKQWFNNTFSPEVVVLIAIILILMLCMILSIVFSGGTGIKQREKELLKENKRLDAVIKAGEKEKQELNDTIAYYKNEVIENKKRDTIVIYKIKQLHYEAKQSVNAIDNMPPDSVQLLFSKFAAEYAVDDSIRNAEAK